MSYVITDVFNNVFMTGNGYKSHEKKVRKYSII